MSEYDPSANNMLQASVTKYNSQILCTHMQLWPQGPKGVVSNYVGHF